MCTARAPGGSWRRASIERGRARTGPVPRPRGARSPSETRLQPSIERSADVASGPRSVRDAREASETGPRGATGRSRARGRSADDAQRACCAWAASTGRPAKGVTSARSMLSTVAAGNVHRIATAGTVRRRSGLPPRGARCRRLVAATGTARRVVARTDPSATAVSSFGRSDRDRAASRCPNRHPSATAVSLSVSVRVSSPGPPRGYRRSVHERGRPGPVVRWRRVSSAVGAVDGQACVSDAAVPASVRPRVARGGWPRCPSPVITPASDDHRR
jgi:hypothetical protein